MNFKIGTIFYHGTIEDIDGELRVGNYDNILWVADSEIIARMYIPRFSVSTLLQNDYTSIIRILDYIPEVLDKELKSREEHYDSLFSLKAAKSKVLSEIMELEKGLIVDLSDEQFDVLEQKINKKITELSSIDDDIKRCNSEKIITNSELDEIASKYILDEYGYDLNVDNRIKVNIDSKIEKNIPEIGKVFKLKLKRDVKLYDRRDGYSSERQHNDFSTFELVKEKGFDGVVIDDYAQSDSEGNFGHIGYGFFENVFEVVEIKESTHPTNTEINHELFNESLSSKEIIVEKPKVLDNMKMSKEMKDLIRPFVTNNSKISKGAIYDLNIPEDFNKRLRDDNLPSGFSFGADKNGFFIYTHRARCKSKLKYMDISDKNIIFIDSTG